ncbi:MAG TPA: hypothetical protein VG248_01645 [Caulobacteraceae bacterium]|nr:hypothetical protein [Caulobacteraceae bacterium]
MAPGAATSTAAPPAPGGFPNFCSIPAVPRDVPTPAAFRTAVVDTRVAGRAAEHQASPATWTLPEGGAEAFAAQARAEAAAPPPLTSEADTEAFAARLRELAAPPRRVHP